MKLNSPKPCDIITNWEIKHNTNNNKYYVHEDVTDGCCILKKEYTSDYLEKVDGDYIVTVDSRHIILVFPSDNNNAYKNLKDVETLLNN